MGHGASGAAAQRVPMQRDVSLGLAVWDWLRRRQYIRQLIWQTIHDKYQFHKK